MPVSVRPPVPPADRGSASKRPRPDPPVVEAPGADADALAIYARIEEGARAAADIAGLGFVVANETWQLMPYRQAIVWRATPADKPRLQAVSGLARLAEDSPNTVWLKALGRHLARLPAGDLPCFVDARSCPESLADGWDEFLATEALVMPIDAPDGRRLGFAAFAVEDPPSPERLALVRRLFGTYGHAWGALLGSRGRQRRVTWRRALGWSAALVALAALFVPVRLSMLAPAEVVALDAAAVTAPMDGVLQRFAVQPNQAVRRGDLLFTLDDTTLRNRREVAFRQLQVARADALAAAQKAFANDASRAELAALNGRVAERQAELAWLDEQLRRIEVRAAADGVVVFGDVNDWQGKPVATGERVALLADRNDAGVLIWLPAADALNIEPGAEVRLFLQVAPLAPLTARLHQTSYQAVVSPDGVASYRLRARFESLTPAQRELARIGLKGTAKLYGEQASLGYYLFRRPLASLRELTGW